MEYDDDRKQQMWDWFFQHYTDPADAGIPHDSGEGGYQYWVLEGKGPYHPKEVLEDEFSEYPQNIIEEVVKDILGGGGEWIRV